MALHGPIMVNGVTIGYWSAQRTEDLRDAGEHEYLCIVNERPTLGGSDRDVEFTVRHHYEDGATVLASKVLATAALRLGVPEHESRNTDSPATEKQIAYVEGLIAERDVLPSILGEVQRMIYAGLTDGDCRSIIPVLQASPHKGPGDHDDWMTPEGNDDSPDQGVHRFDGGGFW